MEGPYYNRFEPPSNSGKRVRTVHRSLRTNVIAAAKHRAELIIEPILNGQWEIAEKLESKVRLRSDRGYHRKIPMLRRGSIHPFETILAHFECWSEPLTAPDPDSRSSAVLSGELIRQFEHTRMADAKTEPARRRTRASVRSYVVQARSLVAPQKMRFY